MGAYIPPILAPVYVYAEIPTTLVPMWPKHVVSLVNTFQSLPPKEFYTDENSCSIDAFNLAFGKVQCYPTDPPTSNIECPATHTSFGRRWSPAPFWMTGAVSHAVGAVR